MNPVTIQTNLGSFQLAPDQIVGLQKVTVPGPDGKPIEATQVIV
jgi:hypothetical protein